MEKGGNIVKNRKKKWLLAGLLLVVLLISYFSNPFLRVKTFIYLHHDQIEESLLDHNGVPVISGVRSVNTWPGEHEMTEFILICSGFGSETTYYGCYYSWDDVPLVFQNGKEHLVQHCHEYWKWQGKGDNRGATQKILDHWYYFEASF